MRDALNLRQMLSVHARLRPDSVGVADLKRSLSFSAWNRRACPLANALLGLGSPAGCGGHAGGGVVGRKIQFGMGPGPAAAGDTVKNLHVVFTMALGGVEGGGIWTHGGLEATPLAENGFL